MASLVNPAPTRGLSPNPNAAMGSLDTTKANNASQGSQATLHNKQPQGHQQPQEQQQQHQRQQESFPSPWDMRIPPAINTSTTNTSPLSSLSNNNSNNNSSVSWPHFRSKPHPTLTVPLTPLGMSQHSMQYVQSDDSDNPMCTPTFDSFRSSFSRRNSTASTTMALDTPPPLSLMDLETLASFQSLNHHLSNVGGSSVPGSSSVSSASASGSASGSASSSIMASSASSSSSQHQRVGSTTTTTTGGGSSHAASPSSIGGGYPFPLFPRNNEPPSTPTRQRGSRANSISMEPGHARKASEDANMSDGGSGTERGRRRSPAVVPFERSVRRSALLPKPKGLLKVFTQLEEEAHHNRHEYDHEREVTLLRKTTQDSMMDIGGALISPGLPRQAPRSPSPFGMVRRPSTSKLNPDQELQAFQRQQEEFDRLLQDSLHHQHQHQHQQQQQQQQQQELSAMQTMSLGGAGNGLGFQPQSQPMVANAATNIMPSSTSTSYSSSSTPSSPLLGPIITRSKRKSSTSEERFDPYHSSHLKRRAVSPSIGPIASSHRPSPSGSPARGHHLQGHHHHGRPAARQPPLFPGTTSATTALGIMGSGSNGQHAQNRISGNLSTTTTTGSPGITPGVNMQHTSRSFSEMSLGMPSKAQQHP